MLISKAKFSCRMSNMFDFLIGIGWRKIGFSFDCEGIIIMLVWWHVFFRWPQFLRNDKQQKPTDKGQNAEENK